VEEADEENSSKGSFKEMIEDYFNKEQQPKTISVFNNNKEKAKNLVSLQMANTRT
jgi:hypothetical protein